MIPENGPVETTPDPFGLLLPDGLGPFVVEVGDTSPPGEAAEIKAEANPTAADLKSPW